MPTVRNPLSAFIITIFAALTLSLLVASLIRVIFLFFLPQNLSGAFEMQLIILSFSLVAVGAVAGRFSIIGSMGFVGSLVGGFFATFLFQTLLFPTDWMVLLALFWGALIGLGGLLTGKLGLRRIDRALSAMPQARKCQRCGAKVGLSAQKCWSCRAFLPPV
ncbi:MAG TPA: hypothetical protein VK723_03645 [Thermoplasmata archaeon]|nr:hypothetical protein [Thermoplasmata archaeon]